MKSDVIDWLIDVRWKDVRCDVNVSTLDAFRRASRYIELQIAVCALL